MSAESSPLPSKRPLTPLVQLALLPSYAVWVFATANGGNKSAQTFLIVGAIVSLICGVTASVMFLRRGTRAAIIVGILFGLLNLMIFAGFGRAALLSHTNMQ